MSKNRPTDLPIRCSCGALRGRVRAVSRSRGNRCVCYCDDCQSFAHFLERADEVLDAHGGTDIFQMASGRLEISDGLDRLACVRLRNSGLLRWYASCCRTPIGNTPRASQMRFLGLIHSCVDHAADGRSRDETLGPVRMRAFGRFAKGNRAELYAHDGAPLKMLFRVAGMLLLARLRGERARSPFFDPTTGRPSARPRLLTDDELRDVEAARDRV